MTQPQLILTNGDIRTMDPHAPRVQALAICDGRITALGSTDEMHALAAPETQVIDLGGRLVLPGFHDTHLHVQDGGQRQSQSVGLEDAETPEQMQTLLRDYAATQTGDWIQGDGWSSSLFGEHNLDRHVLDAAVPDRPCFILASDGHNGCLNTRGCEMLGLTAETPDPANGHFVRAADGTPTGLLLELAVNWAEERMPQPTDEDYAEGVRFALRLANRHGITGVLDASTNERHARVYQALAAADQLTARVLATVRIEAYETTQAALARVTALRKTCQFPMFRVHSAKFFLDGVIENRTAAMIAPYSDAEAGNAALMFTPAQIDEMFTAFDAARFQIHVHAIGDMAVRAALDGMEAARHANAPWPSLHQIAHVQCIAPADVTRFAKLGVVANIQPLWARSDAALTELALPMLGAERGRWVYAFRALRDAGALLALSSDWTVSTLNPFEIIETAITRQPRKSADQPAPFLPEQSLTLAECVEGYTINAAAAGWRAQETGSLSLGKYADLIVLDRDIYRCAPSDIGDTQVLLTLLSGKPVHATAPFCGQA